MDDRVFVVAAIIVVAGLLGGAAAYLTEPVVDQAAAEPRRRALYRSLLLGILAAACVPLFLSLVQSGLMASIFAPPATPPRPPAFEDYLIFTGLCVIAAISSRRFLDSVSRQILRQAERANERASQAELQSAAAAARVDRVEEAVERTAEVVDDQRAGPMPMAANANVVADAAKPYLSEGDRAVLQAMTKHTLRTATGIAEDAGIPKTRIGETLDILAERELIMPAISPTTRGKRWRLTPQGMAALETD